MTKAMATYAYVAPTSIIAVIGLVVARTFRRSRRTAGVSLRGRRPRSGAMLRFQPRRPGGHEWGPLRIPISELRIHGLHPWPNAPGIYLARDDRIHCRGCVEDPRARAAIVKGCDDARQVLVLFGGPNERALVGTNCATHWPATSPTDQCTSSNKAPSGPSSACTPA